MAENMAAATIGRAIKIWREADKARRASAAELIGRAIKNWRESVWPCWMMNWRAWLEDCYRDGERPGLVEVWQADKCLRRFVWHTERRWLAQRRTVCAARQVALASAVARVWKVYRKERAVAVATIGRAIRNWRETAMVRRETAAELIGRAIRNWRETILSIAPCWKENWSPYCRPWMSLKKSLRAISNAELGAEIMPPCWNYVYRTGRVVHRLQPLRRFWRAHPTVQHPETYLCRDFEQLLQDWGLEWFQECFGDTRWRQWVVEWNDNRDDGIRKQIMKEAIFVGDKAQGVGAVAIYANRQLEQWMEQWQIEAEIIADTQRRELEERASDGQAATKKGRWKSPQ